MTCCDGIVLKLSFIIRLWQTVSLNAKTLCSFIYILLKRKAIKFSYYVKINWRTSCNKSVASHYLGKLWFSSGENMQPMLPNITGNRLEKLWQINYRCQNIMWIKLLFFRGLIATVIDVTVTQSNYCNLFGCLQNAERGYTFRAEWH